MEANDTMWGAYWLVTISEVVVGFELLIHVFSSILKTALTHWWVSSVIWSCRLLLQYYSWLRKAKMEREILMNL